MAERFLEQQAAISAALLAPEIRKQEKDLSSLTEADITAAEAVALALKPLKKATLVISQEGTPTLSVIAPLRAKLLEEMHPAQSDPVMVKEMKSAVHQDLQKRYTGLKEQLYLASSLDPCFKSLPFLTDDEREEVFTQLTDNTKTLATEKSSSGPINAEANEAEPAEDSGPPSKKKRDSCALADLLGETYTPEADSIKTTDDAVDEVMKYKEVKPVPLSTNPLSWWKEHEVEFPLLSCQAKQYLCIPGSSVPAESLLNCW